MKIGGNVNPSLACVAGIWKGREREFYVGEKHEGRARREEGNACQETIVFLVFNIYQANVKILIGQNLIRSK